MAAPLAIALRPLAVRDLEEIWLYSSKTWNPDQADRYLDQFDTRLAVLAENPTLGVDYSHVQPEIRRYQIGRHGVFCRIADSKLLVVRVLHERMDAPRLLSEAEE